MMEHSYSMFEKMSEEETARYLDRLLRDRLHTEYGNNPDDRIRFRWQEEWSSVFDTGEHLITNETRDGVLDLASLYELSFWLKDRNIPYWVCSSAGSSFLLYLLGITAVNPLPPHLSCPACGHMEWLPAIGITCSGKEDAFDCSIQPAERLCPSCGKAKMRADGYNLPWQMCWGMRKEAGEERWQQVKRHGICFEIRTTTDIIPTLRNEMAHHWLHRYYPEDCFTEKRYGSSILLKLPHLSICGCYARSELAPDFYERTAGEEEWKALLAEPDAVTPLLKRREDDLPFEDGYVPPVHSFSDLVYLHGLISSTGVWNACSEMMVREMGYSISQLIVFREDVFWYLREHGFTEADAWYYAEMTGHGKHVIPSSEEMINARDRWVLSRLDRTRYLFPKAHEIEYLIFLMRAGVLDNLGKYDNRR